MKGVFMRSERRERAEHAGSILLLDINLLQHTSAVSPFECAVIAKLFTSSRAT